MSFDKVISLEVVDRYSLMNAIVASHEKKQSNWPNATCTSNHCREARHGPIIFIRVGAVKLQLSYHKTTFIDT